jgi:hypothetical protein
MHWTDAIPVLLASVPRERAGRLRPRKHLRVLPTLTRPSLFGSD